MLNMIVYDWNGINGQTRTEIQNNMVDFQIETLKIQKRLNVLMINQFITREFNCVGQIKQNYESDYDQVGCYDDVLKLRLKQYDGYGD